MTEQDLIAYYKRDFESKTGKSIKVTICSKWEAVCEMPQKIAMEIMVQLVLDAAGWSWEQVFTPCRRSMYVFRRGVIYFILVKNGHSLLKIASYTGKEHTTIINAVRSFENHLLSEPLVGKLLIEVMDFIRTNFTYYLKR